MAASRNRGGQTLYRVELDINDPRKVINFQGLFYRQFGRLRHTTEGPDGRLYLLTSIRDRRGNPSADNDRTLRARFR